jgi:hypothetical protein
LGARAWRDCGSTRHRPALPKYGYVLDDDGRLVGVILLICTEVPSHGSSHFRCNISSWYVMPARGDQIHPGDVAYSERVVFGYS